MLHPNQLVGILNAYFGGVTTGYSAVPATWYLALLTTAPDANGSGAVESTGTSYARVSVTNNTTNFPTITAGAIKTNGAVITFPSPGASDWGAIKAVALYDASTAGNLRAWAAVPEFTPVSGNAPVIPAGSLNFSAVNV